MREQDTADFHWVVTGADHFELMEDFSGAPVFPGGDVVKVKLDHEKWGGDATSWKSLLSLRTRLHVRFNVYEHISVESKFVNVMLVASPATFFQDILVFLRQVSLPLFSCSSPWRDDWNDGDDGYKAAGFSDNHNRHGWACAFKGAGHNRLVSRRWLEYGPWRLIRDEESDLSFIQFHDLEADAETALEQAKPGHERMGISLSGGFISKTWLTPTRLPERGFYQADRKVVEYVITGRELEDQAYYEATQSRYHANIAFKGGVDVENIAFVFMDEEDARKHLHELWLRELECWTIIEGEKVRLDDTYTPPPPVKPQWVLDVEAREAAQS